MRAPGRSQRCELRSTVAAGGRLALARVRISLAALIDSGTFAHLNRPILGDETYGHKVRRVRWTADVWVYREFQALSLQPAAPCRSFTPHHTDRHGLAPPTAPGLERARAKSHGVDRPMLHAAELRLPHPITGEARVRHARRATLLRWQVASWRSGASRRARARALRGRESGEATTAEQGRVAGSVSPQKRGKFWRWGCVGSCQESWRRQTRNTERGRRQAAGQRRLTPLVLILGLVRLAMCAIRTANGRRFLCSLKVTEQLKRRALL